MSDVSSLRYQANNKDAQKTAKEQEKKALDNQIHRLREAKTQVAAEKANIKDLRSAVRKQENPAQEWKGRQRDYYHDYTSVDFRRFYDSYYDKTDEALDAIVRKIADLENQSRELGGAIGWLASAINSLWAEIRTAIN